MKLCLTAFVVCCMHLFAAAQDTLVTYRNRIGNLTDRTHALYMRKTFQSGPDNYVRLDYYLTTGTLYSKGQFSDAELTVEQGTLIAYFENGDTMAVKQCVDGLEQGKSLRYHENGNLSDEETYFYGKLEDTSRYYYENGQIASIEVYILDLLQSYQLFHEDGTPDTVTKEVNRPAGFPGGKQGLYQFLGENLIYPDRAFEAGIEGRCHLRFVVDKNGEVVDVEVMEGVPDCRECDAEAIRVVQMMPKWTPGINHNRIMKSYYNLPITFKIKGKKKRK